MKSKIDELQAAISENENGDILINEDIMNEWIEKYSEKEFFDCLSRMEAAGASLRKHANKLEALFID
ncbi:MAG: hypothetical protein AAGJ37_02600 [Pseudomonadota bacterium]